MRVGWQLVERGEGDPLERDGTEARDGSPGRALAAAVVAACCAAPALEHANLVSTCRRTARWWPRRRQRSASASTTRSPWAPETPSSPPTAAPCSPARPPSSEMDASSLPLQSLGNGDYSVRWGVVSDDGHLESGLLAFRVGPQQVGAGVPGLCWRPRASGPPRRTCSRAGCSSAASSSRAGSRCSGCWSRGQAHARRPRRCCSRWSRSSSVGRCSCPRRQATSAIASRSSSRRLMPGARS